MADEKKIEAPKPEEFWVYPLSDDCQTDVEPPGQPGFTLEQKPGTPKKAQRVPSKEVFVALVKRASCPWRKATDKEIEEAKRR